MRVVHLRAPNQHVRGAATLLLTGETPPSGQPGVLVVRRPNGASAVYDLSSALHPLTMHPLEQEEIARMPWHRAEILYNSAASTVSLTFAYIYETDEQTGRKTLMKRQGPVGTDGCQILSLHRPTEIRLSRALWEIKMVSKEQEQRLRAEAVLMARHTRLGSGSLIGELDPCILKWILGRVCPLALAPCFALAPASGGATLGT